MSKGDRVVAAVVEHDVAERGRLLRQCRGAEVHETRAVAVEAEDAAARPRAGDALEVRRSLLLSSVLRTLFLSDVFFSGTLSSLFASLSRSCFLFAASSASRRRR